jgi:hypothetical protein
MKNLNSTNLTFIEPNIPNKGFRMRMASKEKEMVLVREQCRRGS